MTNHKIIAGVLVASAALLSTPAFASPPTDLHIEVPTVFGGASWTFIATGTSVDSGVVCAAGTVRDLASSATGASPAGINFHVIKEFACDGGGAFQVKLEVRFDRKGDNFNWVIMNGTGQYAALRGSGSGLGRPLPAGAPDGVLDVYDGRAHAN